MGCLTENGVALVELKYVDVRKDRHGNVKYYYFRRHKTREKLPGLPGSVEFADAYEALLHASDPERAGPVGDKRDFAPGTFGAVIHSYLQSANFKQKKVRTQALYRDILDKLSASDGSKPIRWLKRRHVRKIRDAHSDTPGAANNILRLIKIILNFAVEDELIDASPAARMKELKGGEYRSWTDEECEAFEARWPEGTMQRRAYMIALYTGQRKSDQVDMTRAHRKDGFIQVSQGKTGEDLWIAEHSLLTAELCRGEQGHMSLLTTSQGKSFDPVYYGAWFADAIYDAGLPDDCVLHGLRKCAARRLAEAGCSEEEIKSITGHKTTAMVAHYVRNANKRKQSSAAILKLENARGSSSAKHVPGRVQNRKKGASK